MHFPTENEGAKPGGNTGSVHGEAPLIRKKEELTPSQYKRQRNNLILMALIVVLIICGLRCLPLPQGSCAGWRRVPRPGGWLRTAAVLRISQ